MQQTLQNIKIVKTFSQEHNEIEKFKDNLNVDENQELKQAILTGISKGLFETSVYFVGAFSLFIGGIFITSSVSDLNNFGFLLRL